MLLLGASSVHIWLSHLRVPSPMVRIPGPFVNAPSLLVHAFPFHFHLPHCLSRGVILTLPTSLYWLPGNGTHWQVAGTCISYTHQGGWSGFLRTDPLVSLPNQISKLHLTSFVGLTPEAEEALVLWKEAVGLGDSSSTFLSSGSSSSSSSVPFPALYPHNRKTKVRLMAV